MRYGIGDVIDPSARPRQTHEDEQNSLHPTRRSGYLTGKKFELWFRVKPLKAFLMDTILLLAIFTLLAVLFTYYFVSGANAFNNSFWSNPVRRFVLTFSASVLDARWKHLEREVRIMTPYRRLHAESASACSTILVTQNGTAISSFAPALLRRNFFHAFVALIAILPDLLIIFIGGVPYSPAQVLEVYYTRTYTSITILYLMVASVPVVVAWRLQNLRTKMPREPDTLLAVWMMMCSE